MPGIGTTSVESMTIRQHYIGLALQGILANPSYAMLTAVQISDKAVTQADSLINRIDNPPTT